VICIMKVLSSLHAWEEPLMKAISETSDLKQFLI